MNMLDVRDINRRDPLRCGRARRAHARKLRLARVGVSAGVWVIAILLGIMLKSFEPVALVCCIICLAWGVWGANYLLTRHH